MPRVTEQLTPTRAGSTINDPGVQGGAPARSVPASSEQPGTPVGGPASQGPANYLTGGLVELDPGPPSAEASGPGEWSGPVTPIPGPLGDQSLHEEEARCYLPSGSTLPEEQLMRGDADTPKDPWGPGLKPHGMGAGEEDQAATPAPPTSAGAAPATPAPALTTGPKGDAHIVRGLTDAQRAPRATWAQPKPNSERFS
jgi:hypothetical protein